MAAIAFDTVHQAERVREQPKTVLAAFVHDGDRSGILPAEAPPTVTAQFQPLDPGIISETIPAFFIGRNKQGFWVAREAGGRAGGIFLFRNSALSFARENTGATGRATIFPSETFELDLENKGNRFIGRLGPLMQRLVALIGNDAHLRTIKRFCLGTLAVVLTTGALAGIMALKVAAVFWRLHY
jgi:hypothetical protein